VIGFFVEIRPSNILFNLTYLAVTTLAKARLAPPKTQVKSALGLRSNDVELIEGLSLEALSHRKK